MSKQKKGLLLVVILLCIISIILMGTYAWSKSNEDNNQYFNREKVVICLDENNAWNEKHQAIRDIILEDCVSWIVGFNEVNSTLLYIREDGVIVEENVVSGEIIAHDMAFLKQYGIGQPIKNVGYTVSGKGITFVHNGSIYVYEKEKGTVEKIVDCTKGEFSHYNVYQWLDEKNILFTKDGEIDSELYSFNCDDAEQKVICAVRSYILSPDKTKVYAIKYHSKPNAIGFELTENIVEINLANGEERVLVEKLETNNYFMKCVDNKYLYYVVGSSEEKWNRVYCLNLENGKKKCVYKTKMDIVGILHQIQNEYELLQKTNELLQEENEELQSTNTKLEKELAEGEELWKRTEAELSDWKKNANIEGWQVFYGKWHTDRYYGTNTDGIQKLEDDKSICIQHDHISMTGHYLTSEPIYSVAVRIKGDVVESVKEIGVENSELITLLKEGHYAEITFDNITNWDREVLEAEKDMIQNVKYYLVDNDTMLCVSPNSSRVYVLGRVWH